MVDSTIPILETHYDTANEHFRVVYPSAENMAVTLGIKITKP